MNEGLGGEDGGEKDEEGEDRACDCDLRSRTIDDEPFLPCSSPRNAPNVI